MIYLILDLCSQFLIYWKCFCPLKFSAQLSSRKNEILPDMDDVKGAARGIAKLWDRYR